MRVSLNEIQVMCRKAFEGMGFAPGDCEDAAELVGWLHVQGLDGVGTLEKALDYLQSEADQPFALCHEDDTLLVIDAHGQSVLRCAATVVELAIEKAMRCGQSVLQIQRCHNRVLLLGYLSRAAQLGLQLQAHWEDARQRHVATFAATANRPHLNSVTLPRISDAFEQSITVLFSRSARPITPVTATHSPLNQGFTVSEHTWQRLKQMANHILVESTETSRLGAGGGSDAD